ncbi:hypothetical protein [Paraglaciecola sp. 2405UD69-4]|uniref:hypothetical protein n=1 Tax=Paraglaciecola sp. 2405UD69-4 TaxID=3391836 RepID=UPI0039C9D772
MKKRNTMQNRHKLASNSRRRQLLKRVQQKVVLRRQHFQILETVDELQQYS